MGNNCKYQQILLIDDSELDNFIHEKVLKKANYSKFIFKISGAKGALEFLDNLMIRSEDNLSELPEVIFVDLNMPMMNGIQFIQAFFDKFSQKSYHPKLIVLTSSVYEGDQQKVKELNPDIIFFQKPLTDQMLQTL
jgi:CheY-like chemotaxis protein